MARAGTEILTLIEQRALAGANLKTMTLQQLEEKLAKIRRTLDFSLLTPEEIQAEINSRRQNQ